MPIILIRGPTGCFLVNPRVYFQSFTIILTYFFNIIICFCQNTWPHGAEDMGVGCPVPSQWSQRLYLHLYLYWYFYKYIILIRDWVFCCNPLAEFTFSIESIRHCQRCLGLGPPADHRRHDVKAKTKNENKTELNQTAVTKPDQNGQRGSQNGPILAPHVPVMFPVIPIFIKVSQPYQPFSKRLFLDS